MGNTIPSHSFFTAYTADKHKEITIKLYKEHDNPLSLIFEDNGIGLPKDFDFTKSDSLGLQLIVGLVQ